MRPVLLLLACLAACESTRPPPHQPADAPPRAATDAALDAPALPARCGEPAGPFAPLSTRCGNFVDGQGRSVVLFGVNARVEGVFDVDLGPGRVPLEPIPPFTLDDARRMRAAGFNALRLPLQWSGLEPTETGGVRPSYLDRVAAVVELCRQAELGVLLDLHQDAYSKEIGEDGAPLWAIVPAPDMLLEGPLNDLAARRFSAQVARAFATFFGDGADGERLRGRYAQMAAALAARFRGDRTVIGLEVFNEPVASDAQVRRLNLLVAQAIRAADSERLVFFEPDVTSRQVLDRSPRPSAPFAVAGGVYAPHTYPLSFTGTDAQRMGFTAETLVPSVRSAREEAGLWGVPLAVTEWGYDPRGIRAEAYYDAMMSAQGRYGASSFLWLWKEQSQDSWGLHAWDAPSRSWTERAEVFRWVARPRPVAVAGDLESWSWDPSARALTVRYAPRPEVTAPHELWLPAALGAWTLRCDGATGAAYEASANVGRVRCAADATSVTAQLAP
ncbi:MAG: cellulase family glycosylhydrolase [Polyangiales bacterium]